MTLRCRTLSAAASACAVVLLAASLAGGCAAPHAGQSGPVQVSLVSSREVVVAGSRVPLSRLPRKLKAMGARSATPIQVAIPENTPMQVVSNVTTSLARAGFRRVLFRRPRQTEVRVE